MSSEKSMKEPEPREEADRYWKTRLAKFKDVTASGNGEAMSRALQAIEDEIQAMQAAMRPVYTRRNALVPIARLPSEVLANIFSFAVINETPIWKKKSSLCTGEAKLGWIKVSHVSRHWRLTALECPSLWSTISFQGADSRWARKMLARAKSASLTIIRADEPVNTDKMLKSKMLEAMVARVAQIEHLHVGHALQDLRFVTKTIAERAPCLKALEVCCPPVKLGHNLPINVAFPSVLFKNDAPRLHSIKLEGCWVQWSSLLFTSLTHLEFGLPKLKRSQNMDLVMAFDPKDEPVVENEFPAIDDYFLPGCDTLLNYLHRMPGLETLILHNAIPSPAPTNNAPLTIALPNLQRFAIEDKRPETCAWVLNRLQVPETCTISIECGHEDHDGLEGYEVLPPFLSAHIAKRTTSSTPLHTLSISDVQGLDIKVWDAWNDVDATKPSAEFEPTFIPILHLSFSWPSYGDSLTRYKRFAILDQVFPLLPLDDLRVITVDDYREWDWDYAGSAAASSLHALGDEALLPQPAAAAAPLKKRKGGKRGPNPLAPPPFLPHLQSLVVADSDLRTERRLDDDEGDQPCAALLKKWLAIRLEVQAESPRVLRFDSCLGLDAGLVKAYRKSVPTVIWNKKKGRKR